MIISYLKVAAYVDNTGSTDATAYLVIFPLPLISSFFRQSGLNKYYKFFEVIESKPEDAREGPVVVPVIVLRVQILFDFLSKSFVIF